MTNYAIDTTESGAVTSDPNYRITEMGIDCGPVRSWRGILADIDAADHGDGAPAVWSVDDQRYLRRDEVASFAESEG